MEYIFEKQVDRMNTGNMKGGFSEKLPEGTLVLCGAEMDYATAPVIRNTLCSFAERGIYGFTLADGRYLNAVRKWMSAVRGLDISCDDIVPTHGTIYGLSTAIRTFTEEGDGVIIQHPSYYRFDRCIERNGRSVVSNPMIERCGKYDIDFEHLEKLMADHANKLMVFCNPHNPTGRVFTGNELRRIAELASKYDVVVFSDEIFGEVIFDGNIAVPYVSVDPEYGITSTSLGKTFNFTGVNHANLIIRSGSLRERYIRQRDREHFGSIDPFFYNALIAAYSAEGYEWVKSMLKHTRDNYDILASSISRSCPELSLSPLEGTFVAWMDCRSLGMTDERLSDFFLKKVHALVDPGADYGPGGSGFVRLNIATPHRNIRRFAADLTEALQQLRQSEKK